MNDVITKRFLCRRKADYKTAGYKDSSKGMNESKENNKFFDIKKKLKTFLILNSIQFSKIRFGFILISEQREDEEQSKSEI